MITLRYDPDTQMHCITLADATTTPVVAALSESEFRPIPSGGMSEPIAMRGAAFTITRTAGITIETTAAPPALVTAATSGIWTAYTGTETEISNTGCITYVRVGGTGFCCIAAKREAQ